MKAVALGIAVLAAVVLLQLAGVAIIAPAAYAAERTFNLLMRCCGEIVAVPATVVVFIGLLGAVLYGAYRWKDWRWRRLISQPPRD